MSSQSKRPLIKKISKFFFDFAKKFHSNIILTNFVPLINFSHLTIKVSKCFGFSFLGSKNVHLMIGKVSDLDLYTDGRYQIAKQVGSATLDLISRLHPSKLEILLSFLHHTKSTAVFEVLQPTYQHVVDLTYLGSTPELKFITWTSAFKEEMEIESLCSIRPDSGIQFAQRLGMTTVKSDLISVEDFQERFDSIRKGKLFHY